MKKYILSIVLSILSATASAENLIESANNSPDNEVDLLSGTERLLFASHKKNNDLCKTNEKRVFTCNLAGGTTVSVCAAAATKKTASPIYYRSGRGKKWKLQIPAKVGNEETNGLVRLIYKDFESGSGGYLRFSGGGHDHVVYDWFIAGMGYRSGVRLVKAGAKGEAFNRTPVTARKCLNQGSSAARMNFDFLVDVDLLDDDQELAPPFD